MYNVTNLTSVALSQPAIVTAEQTASLMREYCSTISHGTGWLIIVAMIMWILQPALDKWLYRAHEKTPLGIKPATIMFIYKWLGLGLLVLCLYSIFFMY